MTRVVVLVPWRPGDSHRERAWSIVRTDLEEVAPVFTADSPNEFNRAEAINAASRAAGDWDIAIVADSDTVHAEGNLKEAIVMAEMTGSAVVPFDRRYKLSEVGTTKLIAAYCPTEPSEEDYEPGEYKARWNMPGYRAWRRGGTIVLPRAAWDRVGGFDEGFRGWGHEDCAQRIALETLVGLEVLPGPAWHLFHPMQPRERPYGFVVNQQRFDRLYRRYHRKPAAMERSLRRVNA